MERQCKRKKDYDFLATWNVLSLKRPGALAKLKEELNKYNIAVAAIQEVRWSGDNIFDSGDFTICHSSCNDQTQFGTGFIIHKRYKQLIMDFVPVDPRLCVLRLRGRFFNTTIINGHAPTEDKGDEQKDAFYDKLEQLYMRAPKHDIKIVIGDFNAQLGSEDKVSANVGQFSLHKNTNNNGTRLIDFAVSKNLVISSTHFQHKNIHKGTWRHPDGINTSQIDHVLIDSRHASDILDVVSCRGADCDSDHFMVRIKYKQRISILGKFRGQVHKRYDVDKLQNKLIMEEYRNEIEDNLKKLYTNKESDPESMETKWNSIKQSIHNAANKILGERPRQKKNHWFDKECIKALEERNTARLNMLQRNTRANTENYKEKRRVAKNLCRRKKRNYEEQMIEDLQDQFGRNESKKFYEGIRRIRSGFQPRTTMCKNKNGEIVTDDTSVLSVWATYFKELLNADENRTTDVNIFYGPQLDIKPPTLQTVLGTIRNMKNNRAPGEDLITAELIKCGGRILWNKIYELILQIWNTEQIPQDWNTAVICPIHKKNDKLKCSNYRGISLLNVSYKIFTNIVAKYLEPYVEEITGDYQCGFRKGRSTSDQIFSLRIILEKAYEYNIDIHQLYIDYKQAYDSISRSQLIEIMKEFGIPNKLVNLVKMTLEKTNNKVKIQGKLSASFLTTAGLRQGDSLSTLLFNLCMEKIIRNIKINPGGTIGNRTSQCLAYADDVVVLGRSVNYLSETVKDLIEAASQVGLKINPDKTKYMTKKEEHQIRTLEIEGIKYERVKQFKYLGSLITEENEIEREIKERINLGNTCYRALIHILRKRYLSKILKIRLYKTVIRPIVLYGSESWTLTVKSQKLLMSWERKILRRIYGPKYDNYVWRIRTNVEIMDMYKTPDIVAVVKLGRLKWLGHVQRMDDQRMVKRIMEGKLGGRRRRGRPRLRWIDDVEEDLRRLGIKRWRTKALDRKEWASVIKEAEARLKGP